MVLVHDDDLTRLDGIYGNTVSRGSLQCIIEIDISSWFSYFFQPPDTLHPDILSNRIRSLNPRVYKTRIGESSTSQLSISDRKVAHRKDVPSPPNSANAEIGSAWVATLSNIFENHSEFPIHLRLHMPLKK